MNPVNPFLRSAFAVCLVALCTTGGLAQAHLHDMRWFLMDGSYVPVDNGEPIDERPLAETNWLFDGPDYHELYKKVALLEARVARRAAIISRSLDEQAAALFTNDQLKWLADRDAKCNQYWDPDRNYVGEQAPMKYMRCLGTESLNRLQQIRDGKFRVITIGSWNNPWLNANSESIGHRLLQAHREGKLKAYNRMFTVTERWGNDAGWPLPESWSPARLYYMYDSVQHNGRFYRARVANKNASPGTDSSWGVYVREKQRLTPLYAYPGEADKLVNTDLTKLVASIEYPAADPWEPSIDYATGSIAQVGKVLYECKVDCRQVPVTDTSYWRVLKHDVSIGDTLYFNSKTDLRELVMIEYLEYSGRDTTFYPQFLEVGGTDPRSGMYIGVAAFRYNDVVDYLKTYDNTILTSTQFLDTGNGAVALHNDNVAQALTKNKVASIDTLNTLLDIFAARKFAFVYFPDPISENLMAEHLSYLKGNLTKPAPQVAAEFEAEFYLADNPNIVTGSLPPLRSIVYRVTYILKTKAFTFEPLSIRTANASSSGDQLTEWTPEQYYESLRKIVGAEKLKSNILRGTLGFSSVLRLTDFRQIPVKPKKSTR